MSSPVALVNFLLAPVRGPRVTSQLAGQEGLEPPTAGFGDRDSSQLSYCPLLSYCLCAAPQACFRCLTGDHQMLKCTLPTASASNRALFCLAADATATRPARGRPLARAGPGWSPRGVAPPGRPEVG